MASGDSGASARGVPAEKYEKPVWVNNLVKKGLSDVKKVIPEILKSKFQVAAAKEMDVLTRAGVFKPVEKVQVKLRSKGSILANVPAC